MLQATTQQRWLPLGVLVAAILAGAAALISPLAMIGGVGLVALILILVNQAVAVPFLIAAAAINRYGLQWGDAEVRLEIVVTLLLVAVLADRLAVRTLSWRELNVPLLWPLAAYAGLNVFSTVFFAVDKVRGLKLDAEIIATGLTFVVVVVLLRQLVSLRSVLKVLWVVTTVEAAFGLMAILAFVAHVSHVGVQIGDNGLPMVYGTQWEANIFGSFLLGNFFLLLGDYVSGHRSALRALSLLVVVLGIGVSMTRTVWVGLVLGLIVFGVLALRKRIGNAILSILIAIPILALVALIVGSATPFAGRLLDVANLQTSSASGRLVLFEAGISDWLHSPIFGLGTGSFNFNAQPGQPHPWLPNLFLLTLHDTGIVGAAALLWLIVAFYRFMWRTVREDSPLSVLAIGSIASFTALLLAFQTTSGFWFAYPWIVVGIGVAAARLSREAA